MIDIFIPSYKRAKNLKTVKYFTKMGYSPDKIHVVIDNETPDIRDYEIECKKFGCNLHVFNIDESRERYDYVHRPSVSRRSAGQARNMFYDIAKSLGISFYVVQDDDTRSMQIKKFGKYKRIAKLEEINFVFESVKDFMLKRRIGLFGLSQTGDFIGGLNDKLLRHKLMNTTFVNTNFVYRGERGVQNDDASQYAAVVNNGLFTGSHGDGLVLNQVVSATAKGGLTELYNECKLLNKALVPVIQFPSSVFANRQIKNGNRIHHSIRRKFIAPCIIHDPSGRDNIGWDTFEEDVPFTLESF